jgi:hypothetical protein
VLQRRLTNAAGSAVLVSPPQRLVDARFLRRYRHVAEFRDADTPRATGSS